MSNSLQGLNVFLIGMMGSGKTTVAKVLAQQLNYRFFDTDVLVERVAGQSIKEIFATEGEKKFRQLESQVLQELSACTKSAIATGGGIVLHQLNWSYLRDGLIVWLDIPIDLLVERLAKDDTRPLLQEADLKTTLTKIFEERKSLYSQADLHIVIKPNQTPGEIARAILAKIPTVIKGKTLPPQ